MLSILGIPVGYVTGNLTISADALAQHHVLAFCYLIVLVICFLAGSTVSGLLVKSQSFKMDKRYTATILLQFFTLLIAAILLSHQHTASSYFLAFTMGLQNAMTTHYGSALIRTTHMTGTTTDLGILIARCIKGEPIEYWKMILYSCLIIGFLLGAIAGAFLYPVFSNKAFILSFLFYIFMLAWPRVQNNEEKQMSLF